MKTQKYVTIANILRNKILSGEYPVKSKLPYEREMIAQFQASKMTIKKATDILVDEGMITKIKAKGTFVNDFAEGSLDQMKQGNYFRGLTALYADITLTSHVLVFEIIPSDAFISDKLNLSVNTAVYHIKRVRIKDEQPFVVEEIWMPASLIVNLKRVHVEHSIYEYIEQQLGYIIDKSHRRIEVHTANETDAALLQIAIGQPVILARQTGRFSTGQVFEYSKATHLGETFSMDVILTRRN